MLVPDWPRGRIWQSFNPIECNLEYLRLPQPCPKPETWEIYFRAKCLMSG
jgi:hypothetical protein